MSLFSFFKKNKESYSLVFNIGSGSVSGGIVKFTEDIGVNMSYYSKENIPFQKTVSILKHLDLMRDSLATLAGRIQKEGLQKLNLSKSSNASINRVFYMFSSPWSASQVKIIKIKEPKVFKITEEYVTRVINSQERQFQEEISKTGKIIEKKIIQLKINGYVVSDIINKTAKDIEIAVFFTVVPKEILQILDDVVSKVFAVNNVWCHSLSLSVFSVIRDMFPHKEDFIHIDISEEITDISVIRDDLMTSVASIPFGRNHFIRELSTVLKVSEEIADSMIKMHSLKSNDELGAIKLSVAMDTAAKNWLTSITDVLNSYKEKIYVPDSIFLVANSDLVPFLKNKLEKNDFKVLLVDNKKIKPPIVGDDIVFKLELMFLDKLYKI